MSHTTTDMPLSKIPTSSPTEPENHLDSMPIEAHTAAGPTLLADAESPGRVEQKSLYVFRRLREERTLPGPVLLGLMLAALFLVMSLAGWNDASQGPLLPSLQAYYHVDYLVISLIFVFGFLGFMISGITNVYISDHFGFGIAATFGAFMQMTGYVLMCWGGPYPLFVFAYVLNGFGLGLEDAQVNSLTTRLSNASAKMFLMHAFYGFGATVSPLISTQFVKHVPRFYLYFCVSVGLALTTVIVLAIVFQGRTEDQIVGRRQPDPVTGNRIGQDTSSRAGMGTVAETPGEKHERPVHSGGSGGKMKAIMATPVVHYMAFYTMIYVGVEVTIGGWTTSFLETQRGGNSSVGYATTGYFAGLTLGRVVLIPVTNYLGKHNCIYIYSAIAIALDLIIWFTHSIPANAVCFALIGFVLGPMYPIVMMAIIDVLPGELQAGCIGWVASLGQAGSAIMPFVAGAISNKYGVWILQPLVIAFLAFSLILWFLVPRPKGFRV